jgi:hypothetical protein
LTDDIKQTAKTLGNLDLGEWSDTGLGDLVVTLDWSNDYPQEKQSLRNVELHAFLGLSTPTGRERDEDRAFSIALGNDGAWSLPFGLGIDLDFKYRIALGAEAQFEVIFDDTKVRRIKTEEHQTEFLLFNKERVTKDHGLSWRFYLYLQGFRFWRGFSLKGAYEYAKHDSDRLTPKSDRVSATVANGSRTLNEWNMHHFVFQLNYDFFKETGNFAITPQLSFFYKLPITGQRVINPHTIGGQLVVNF